MLVCVVDPDPAVRRSVAALLRSLGAEGRAYAETWASRRMAERLAAAYATLTRQPT